MEQEELTDILDGTDALTAFIREFGENMSVGIVSLITSKKQKKKESEVECTHRIRELVRSWISYNGETEFKPSVEGPSRI